MQNRRGRGISLLLIALMLVMMMMFFRDMGTTSEEYSLLLEKFKTHQVSGFELDLGNGKLTYQLKSDETPVVRQYSVPDVDLFLLDIRDSIAEYDAENPDAPMLYNYTASTNIGSLLLNLLPMLLLIGAVVMFYFMMSQQGGGKIGNIGRAKTKQGGAEGGRKATFVDVAGADEEKEELSEIVEYLKNPAKFNALGAKIPRGVLLVGPPGTGKTLLARAVAGEAGVPFFSISGSDFVELYVGVGASRVRDLFENAKKQRPSIIFIDEIDAVGRQRGAGLGGGHDEREQTLNQLLVEMDGFTGNEGVIVMAATNRVDILDHALLRPGRFDRQVYVGYPDVKGREEILKVHARNKPLGPDVNLRTIAKSTPGFTGADLENLLNEAALLAARNNRKAITEPDIEEASIKVVAGPEKKSRVVTERDRRITAYHEAGHAIATYFATPDKLVHQISIIQRGMAAGYTMSLPEDDDQHVTKSAMNNEIVTLLGGRVAEQIVLEDVSTGASNDLERATGIARAMVTKYGFSDKLGPVVYGSGHDEVFLGRDFTQSRNYSEEIANLIDNEIRDIVEASYAVCKKILEDNIEKLHEVTNCLLEREKLDSDEFRKIMDPTYVPPLEDVDLGVTPVAKTVEAQDAAGTESATSALPQSAQPPEDEDEVVQEAPPTSGEDDRFDS